MRTFSCFCGTTIEADDLAAIVAPARAHMNEAHGMKLTEANTRDYFEAEDRLSPVRPRVDELGGVEIRPATTDTLDDVLYFFDHEGFAGKPEWAACYCMDSHLADREGYCRERNRAALIERIRNGATTGFIAYTEGRVAAWCNASPRAEFPIHAGCDEHPDDTVGSIVCFVVAPPYRRHGLSTRLLETALGSFVERSFSIAEAYPRKEVQDEASSFPGPLSMYERAGFKQVREYPGGVVVQKVLT